MLNPKILHILDHSLPVHSGYAFRSQAIVLAQKAKGWYPVVITSPKHEENPNIVWKEQELVGDILCYRTPKAEGSPFPGVSEIKLMGCLYKRLGTVIQQERPDILQAHSPILTAIPAIRMAKRYRLPVVYEMRSLWEDAAVSRGVYGQRSWKYRVARALETWVCRSVDHTTVLCEGIKEDLILRGISREKLTVIPNGVDATMFCPAQPDLGFQAKWRLEGRKIIAFMGSFFRWEGLDLLVDACKILSQERNDIMLLLIGHGETERELRTQVNRLGMESHVVWPGAIPQRQLPGIYALVDVLAYPRPSMRLTELVTPLKPLEAMAMGKAIVASDVGGHQELIRHDQTGVLFKAGDVGGLARALHRVLTDDPLRKALEEKGRQWVLEHREWAKTIEGYSSVYSQLMKL